MCFWNTMNRFLFQSIFLVFKVAAQVPVPPYSTYTYNEHVDKYYKFQSTPATWYNAKLQCQNEGATLAMPRNEHEIEVLIEIFKVYPASALTGTTTPNFAFLGFHDYFQEQDFVAINGISLQYFYHKWLPNNPGNSRSENCVSMYRSGKINVASCTNPQVYFCQKEGNTPSFFSDFGKCDYNDSAYVFSTATGRHYRLHTKPTTWANARVVCGLECGNLAIINNVQEESFLVSLFDSAQDELNLVPNNDYAFLGIHDMFKEGEFVTLNDQKLSNLGYTNWATGQPDNALGVENCVAMTITGPTDDVGCDGEAPFFCERIVLNPYEYFPDVDLYYKFHREPLKWYDARLKCSEEKASLALPRNKNEVDTIISIFSRYTSTSLTDVQFPNQVLIGFHDIFLENQYVSLSGKPLQYYFHEWENNQPNNINNEDCGSMNRNGKLEDISCQVPSTFICEKPGREQKSSQVNSKCASNDEAYIYAGADGIEKCYKVHMNPRRWLTARDICVLEGGNLAVVRNVAEENFIKKIILDPNNRVGYSNDPDFALIGFHDMYKEGRFTTVLDEDLGSIGYMRWGSGEPSNGPEENCGAIHITGTLSDMSCTDRNIFVCEQPAILVEERFQKGTVSWMIDYLKYFFGFV